MFRRIIPRINLKKNDWKLENLNDRVSYLNDGVAKCQSDINTIYLCMAISATFNIVPIMVKTIFF